MVVKPGPKKPHAGMYKSGQKAGPGRPPLPTDVRNAKMFMRQEFDRIVMAFTKMQVQDLESFISKKQGTALEMAIATCYFKAISRGENANLGFFLDRIIGKPKQQVEVLADVKNTVSVSNDQLIRMARELVADDDGTE